MMKYIFPIASVLMVGLLFWLTIQVGQYVKPGQPISYYIGLAIGNLIVPVIFSGIAGVIKRSFSKDKAYDWRMFYIFFLSFCFISVLGKYNELQAHKQGTPIEMQKVSE